MEPRTKTLAEWIRIRRKETGESLPKIAEKTGVSPNYLSDLQLGNKTNPSFAKLSRIISYLRIDFYDITPPKDKRPY